MVEYKKGYFAKSKAGHDKGKIYIIIEETLSTGKGDFVYLTDGELKPIDNPKKKRIKHIQVIMTCDEQIDSLIRDGQVIRNEDIKRAIKAYSNK